MKSQDVSQCREVKSTFLTACINEGYEGNSGEVPPSVPVREFWQRSREELALPPPLSSNKEPQREPEFPPLTSAES